MKLNKNNTAIICSVIACLGTILGITGIWAAERYASTPQNAESKETTVTTAQVYDLWEITFVYDWQKQQEKIESDPADVKQSDLEKYGKSCNYLEQENILTTETNTVCEQVDMYWP